jgi:hypothetical protein
MNVKELYKQIPDWVKTGLWIAISAGLTALISFLLEVPELLPYYGILNFLMFALKEASKKK